MKKQIFAIIVALGISVVINASQTYGQLTQVIKVDVPFTFSANNKTFPAGTYLINPAADSRALWKIQSASQKRGVFLLARNLSEVAQAGNTRLTFRRYGNRYFLISFKTPSYQIELPQSGSEKDLQRSEVKLAKLDLETIEIKGF